MAPHLLVNVENEMEASSPEPVSAEAAYYHANERGFWIVAVRV